jgi:ADP-dependent NAD(P)H-hydrate dehydratase
MNKITQVPKLPIRAKDAHKGTFGKVCIIGGSVGMAGAVALAGKASLRSGAGLVRVAIPESVLPVAAALEPCYMTVPLPEDGDGQISSEAVSTLIDMAIIDDVVAFGAGTGTNKGVRDSLLAVLRQMGETVVVDADGLNCLAKAPEWIGKKQASVILTPHPGEMKRLWASQIREPMPEDRIEQAMELAEKTDSTVVLKGYETVVADKDNFYVNTTGNPGMATGGSGDVLGGVITAIVSQGLNDFDASVLGVYIHGLAGDIAVEKVGETSLIASDIIECLGEAFIRHAKK